MVAALNPRAADRSGRYQPPYRHLLKWAAIIGGALLLIGIGAAMGRAGAPAEPDGRAKAADSGPTRLEGLVPTGYVRTVDGAVAAALHFDTVMYGPSGVAATTRGEVLSAMAADQAAADQLDRYLTSLLGADVRRDDGGARRSLLRRAPVGYEVRAYSTDRSTVAVWGAWASGDLGEVLAGGSNVSWLTLVWQDDDWRLLHVEDEGVIVSSLERFERLEGVSLAPLD